MVRYSLRLPETLHNKLKELAEAEGVSLNQYLVYALARQAWDPEGTGAVQLGPPVRQQVAELRKLRAQRKPASPEDSTFDKEREKDRRKVDGKEELRR